MTEFQRLYTGRLWSVMAWDQLTALWQRIDPAAGWYLVAVGVSPAPTSGMLPAAAADVSAFIVYADNLENPRLIKIYDPNNLGSSCGSSKTPHPPGWIMSRLPPDEIIATRAAPENRKRWWQGLLGDS